MIFRHPNAGRLTRQDVTPAYDGYAVASSGFWQTAAAAELIGAATITLTATGRMAAQLKGAATVALSTAGLLAQSPLIGAATLVLTIAAPDTVLGGLIVDPPLEGSRFVYRAYLTATGFADLELPISSFQARTRLSTPNYLAVVVPNPLPYIAAITERSVGRLVIRSGFALADGTELLEMLTSGVFNSFRYDLGPFSGSATLVAYDYRAPRPSLTRAVRGISLRAMSNGVRRIRCEPDMYLQPGDVADLGDGETLTVEQISYIVGANRATMEIAEAEPV